MCTQSPQLGRLRTAYGPQISLYFFVYYNEYVAKASKFCWTGKGLKVLQLFECCRGDPYMTANRNLVHLDHS